MIEWVGRESSFGLEDGGLGKRIIWILSRVFVWVLFLIL